MNDENIIRYSQELIIPRDMSGSILIRYYSPWGDGTLDGWQKIVPMPDTKVIPLKTPPSPDVSLTERGDDIEFYLFFPGMFPYETGSLGLGFDQRAQYYRGYFDEVPYERLVLFSGEFFKMGYFSITLYDYYMCPLKNIVDSDVRASNHMNPYITGNPSIFSYDNSKSELKDDKLLSDEHARPRGLVNFDETLTNNTTYMREGELPIFKLSREMSAGSLGEEVSEDGCSSSYLFSPYNKEKPYQVLRVKVPKTFIADDNPDMVFGDYQTREFSISAHNREYSEELLDFWTIDSRLLNKYKDSEGYAYVFFAPSGFVKDLIAEQDTPEKTAPLLEWGAYKGFVLSEATYAMIIRYKENNPTWEGNPINAPCYNNESDNQPLLPGVLGDYQPELFGGTLEEFEAGCLGAVNNRASWPKYSKNN